MNITSLKKKFPKKDIPATPFFVSVAGNIGVGKSMITTMIGEVFGWQMYFEPVINNPYLEDYYKDMKRWSFHLQVYFLSKRFEVQKEILDHPGSAVQDRTIYEDVEIFAPDPAPARAAWTTATTRTTARSSATCWPSCSPRI